MIKTDTKELKLREKLIKLALLQHHKLYEHQKTGPNTFDCAGLIWFLYKEILKINLYGNEPILSATTKIMTNHYGKLTQFIENDLYKNIDLIKKGDIIFFHTQSLKENIPTNTNKYPGHCGIYLGDNNFIHCPKKEGKVVINNFKENEYWKNTLVASKDILSNSHKQKEKQLIKEKNN